MRERERERERKREKERERIGIEIHVAFQLSYRNTQTEHHFESNWKSWRFGE